MGNDSLKDILARQREAKQRIVSTQLPTQATVPTVPQIAKPSIPQAAALPQVKSNPLAAALQAVKTAPTMMPTVAKPKPEITKPVAQQPEISAEEYQHETQPDSLPENDAEQIRAALDFLESSFDHPDQLKQAIQKIMIDIQAKPHLADMLYPEDIGLCVKALREAHGVVVIEKALVNEKKAKTAARANEIEDFMKDMGGFKLKV